ncbi:MAG: M20/M25/M40 family metallo-hydrolase [Clostridia bacterium]|nr:M20/M25/M40 family metallo-hydrolase [Clostridia bacterium]
MIELIKRLMKTGSVSGREKNIADVIRAEVTPYADEVYTDNLGNLYAHKRGNGKKLMLAAHMDEIGFFATYIEDSGLVRVTPVGGINFVSAAYSHVTFENGTRGIIVPEGGTTGADLSNGEKYYIDLGTTSRRQTEKKISIGDFAVCDSSITRLNGRRYVGRPFDDRIGCAVLIECMKKVENCDNDLYFVFTAQEEVGCRGSLPAAFNVQPDYAIAVDVTGTGDAPGAKNMVVKLGGGAAIKIRDNSVICDIGFVEMMKSVANEKKIKHQLEILPYGGTDTGSMQRSAKGTVAGAVSVPTRFIHSAVEMIDMADVDAVIKLLDAIIAKSL